jgi:predicted permease
MSLFKLLVFPLFCYGAIYFLPLPMPFKASILILAGTPCASIILNLAEIHHSETEISANCVLVSTLLCIVTIPFLTLLVG